MRKKIFPRGFQKSCGGFTLIELLVVVAIIALLIAILLPSLSRARARGRTTRCLTSVRGLEAGIQIYVADWQGMFPLREDPLHSWTQILMNGAQQNPDGSVKTGGGYGGTDKMTTCPEAILPLNGSASAAGFGAVGTANLQWANSGYTADGLCGSYGINGWIYAQYGPDDGFQTQIMTVMGISASEASSSFINQTRRMDPGSIPAIMDCNWRHLFPRSTDPAPTDLIAPGPNREPTGAYLFNHPLERAVMDRHNKAINIAFLDGHAETVKLGALWTLKWSAIWKRNAPQSIP